MGKKNADQRKTNAEKRIALGGTLTDERLKLVVGGSGPEDDSGDRLASNHNGKLVKVGIKTATRVR